MKKYQITDDDLFEIIMDRLVYEDHTFEEYCAACDNFDTDACPFQGKVDVNTYWKKLNCQCFYD